MSAPLEPPARAASLWPELLERQLANAGPGTHICPIYSNPSDRLRVLVAFFEGGLVRGEQCLYIADPDRATEVAQALQALGPPASTEVDRGSLLLVTTRELSANRRPAAAIASRSACASCGSSTSICVIRSGDACSCASARTFRSTRGY